MKTICALVLLFGFASAQPPDMPKPVKEHEWLQKMFVGEWAGTGECMMEPGKTIKCEGTESCKAVGGHWIQSTMKGKFAGMDMTGVMQVGYDPKTKKFIGTWIDSMGGHMYQYTGSVDATGKVLTLESEGPMPGTDKMVKMKDVTEFKSDTEKTMTSFILMEDKWVQCMTMTSKKTAK